MERENGGLTMWMELSNTWILLLNILGIPTAHIALSLIATKLPTELFKRDLPRRNSAFELWLHKHIFHTRKWKALLPDAAPWMGGFAKGQLQSRDYNYLHRFVTETRRGELAHWAQLFVISTFIAWNPWPANVVIILYAILSNLPCILNLRLTRARLQTVLAK